MGKRIHFYSPGRWAQSSHVGEFLPRMGRRAQTEQSLENSDERRGGEGRGTEERGGEGRGGAELVENSVGEDLSLQAQAWGPLSFLFF